MIFQLKQVSKPTFLNTKENEPEEYDVVVVGGGPAGLSVASELSKELKVLVVEKNDIGTTTKSWLVPMFISEYEPNKDLREFFYSGASKFMAKTYSGANVIWEAKASELVPTKKLQKYDYIKEHEILKYWGNVILQNKSVIEKSFYVDHHVKDDYVLIKTSKGFKSAKLLIDASGHDSAILKKYEVNFTNNYWWSVYGFIVKHPEPVGSREIREITDLSYMDKLHEGDYMLWQTIDRTNSNNLCSLRNGRPVLEYEVLDRNHTFILVLYLTKAKVSFDTMKQAFNEMYASEDISKKFNGAILHELKYGWYPSGDKPPKIARDRVAFIGDACSWSTPCGWGMGVILKNYKEYAKETITLFKENKLSAKYLNNVIKLTIAEKHQVYLNRLASHFLANSSTKQLDQFISIFKDIGGEICERLFTLKINHNEIVKLLLKARKAFGLRNMVKMIPREDIPAVLKEVFYLLLDLIITPNDSHYADEYTEEKPNNTETKGVVS